MKYLQSTGLDVRRCTRLVDAIIDLASGNAILILN